MKKKPVDPIVHSFLIAIAREGGLARMRALKNNPKRLSEIGKMGGEATRAYHLRKKRLKSKKS